MSDEVITQTVEIVEPEAPAEVKQPTRDELRSNGWTAKELDAAEKRGMIPKPEEKKETPKAEEPKKEDPKVEVKELPKEEPKKDYSGSQHLKEMDLTEEQEKELRRLFPFIGGKMNPVEALYWRQKHERTYKQNERSQRIALEEKVKQLEAQITAAASTVRKSVEVDENGLEIDPEDKPLTMKQLREMQQKEAEERAKQDKDLNERARVVSEAQQSQEEYARTVLPDFDETVKLAKEVMQNLDAMVPEKWRQGKVVDLVQKLQLAAAQADKLGLDDYHAAFIAHEIGQFHPNYGKANGQGAEPHNDGNSKDPNKANGGQSLTPEQMKRIENNTQRRASSASIPGSGGRRSVAPEDVTIQEFLRMNPAQRDSFREKHPEQYAKLRRG